MRAPVPRRTDEHPRRPRRPRPQHPRHPHRTRPRPRHRDRYRYRSPGDPEQAAFAADWEDWHRTKDARLASEHGFLAITGLHWLAEEPQRFPDVPGAWSTGPEGVTVALDEGTELVVDGTAVRGRYGFGVIPEREGVDAVWGDTVIEVAERGGRDVVRPRHPDHPLRVEFAGTPA